jgi:hypothetical protein
MRAVNIKVERADINCGRGSKWGNPFVIGKDGSREDVVRKHKEWILLWLKEKKEVIIVCYGRRYTNKVVDDVEELRGLKCGCYCKPLACHLDVFVEFLNEN